jgi:toxin ParE1/3/4
MVQVVWAQPALDDLQEIHHYIARDSAQYAQRMVEQIIEAAGLLKQFPQLGEVLHELPESGYRQRIVKPYRLIYREESARPRVVIVAVIHASRDLPTILEERGMT